MAPLAIGSVHPWAFKPLEAGFFLIAAAWMAKLWRRGMSFDPVRRLGPMLATSGGFLLLIAFQSCPLSPSLTRVLSPATYRLYEETLAGWPRRAPYSGFVANAKLKQSPRVNTPFILPNVRAAQVRLGSLRFQPDPGTRPALHLAPAASHRAVPATPRARWRSLSLAPVLTYPALLAASALCALFLVVSCYPVDDEAKGAEQKFQCLLITAVLVSGAIVAAIGLAQRMAWNGKILWCFVPSDWGAPMMSRLPRASGPFVNPDHFANYLAMVLPLALGGALFRSRLAPTREPGFFRIACFTASLIIFSALVLSLSRGGWAAAIVGITVLLRLTFPAAAEQRRGSDSGRTAASGTHRAQPYHSTKYSFRHPRGFYIAGFCALMLMTLLIVGPQGRQQTELRLQQTASGGGNLSFRVAAWEDSLRMARDFPAFGVGLGAWPELFPHYRRAPWSDLFLREAHNDYVQLLTETGVVGFCVAAAFFLFAGKSIYSGFDRIEQLDLPEAAGILGGIAAMGVHEFFDFSFRIPANAVLCTVLLGIAVRMTRRAGDQPRVASARRWSVCGGVLFLLLAVAAGAQRASAYEYDAPVPADAAQACAFVLRHPASSLAHLALAKTLAESKQKRNELERAVWLAPTDPRPRDSYVRSLVRAKQVDRAMGQLALSVCASPDWGTHSYLTPAAALWYSPAERAGIVSGFKCAIARNYGGAVDGLGRLYDTLGNFSDEASLYAHAAANENELPLRAVYLTRAGEASVHAGDLKFAAKEFLAAEGADPPNSAPYDGLVRLVYGPEGKIAMARATVQRGVANGADPAALYSALAYAAQRAGDSNAAGSAMRKLVQNDPGFDNTMRLGTWYLAAQKLDLAIATLERAVQMNPQSPDAYHLLAVARERNYDYPAADRDFTRAVALAPKNSQLRDEYAAFRKRIGYTPHRAAASN